MNTIFKSKKSLFLTILLALAVSPTLASAQVVQADLTPQAHAALVADIEKKINDLMVQILLARIDELKVQIQTLLANQATQATQLGAVESKVNTVVTQTAPVMIPIPVAPTVSFGTVSCRIAQELYGNWPSANVLADKYNITVPITYGNLSRTLEHSETNLPNHAHKDRTATTTHLFTFQIGNHQGIQEVVVPPCQ